MKTNTQLKYVLFAAISMIPLIYLAIVWNTVPETVPIHFDGNWQPNGFGNRSTLWITTTLMTAISLGVYVLLQNMHLIDPKRAGKAVPGTFDKIAVGIVLFMFAINQITLMASTGHPDIMKHALFPAIGLLFAFLGNFMHNVKPNYFVGLRLPWTLNNDENWRKTHQLAGKLWFWGGLLLAGSSFFVKSSFESILMMAIIIPLVLIPSIYSFTLYRKMAKEAL
jgi:uncharacterized membrane protein